MCIRDRPTVIVSDRGKEFLNSVMQDLTKWLGVSHDKTSPHHPQTNASAERYNRTMKAYLTAMLDNEETLDWEEWLPALMFSYNTQVHKSTMDSPFFLTYLHDPKLPFFDIENPQPLYKDGYVPEAAARLGTAYKAAREHICLLYTSPSPRDS